MAQVRSSITETFSITDGGPLHWLLVRLGHAGSERRLVLRRALAAVSITWLPLLLLSLLLPCLLVPLGRDAIRRRHDMILRQQDQAVLED